MQAPAGPPPRLAEILDDLASRFIINCPDEERESFDRLLFQIEAAHWFFEDFYREQHPSLPSFCLRDFAEQMFKHCPVLQPYHKWIQQIYTSFTNYKTRVPVCGAIMLNPTLDKCVLVKGWSAKSSWTFPKGKVNKDEPEIDCAAREVYEETGYELKGMLCEEDSVEVTMRQQRARMFIVAGIPEDAVFVPQTRKEISKVDWHRVDDLPTYSGKAAASSNGNHYWMVMPYMRALKAWVAARRKQIAAANAGAKGKRARNGRGQAQQQPVAGGSQHDYYQYPPAAGTGSFDFNAFAAAIPYPSAPPVASAYHSHPISVPPHAAMYGHPPRPGGDPAHPFSTSLPSPSRAAHFAPPAPARPLPAPSPPPVFPTPLEPPPPYVPSLRPNSLSDLVPSAPSTTLTRVPLSALFGTDAAPPKTPPATSPKAPAAGHSALSAALHRPHAPPLPPHHPPAAPAAPAAQGGPSNPLLNFSFNTLELLECLDLEAGPAGKGA